MLQFNAFLLMYPGVSASNVSKTSDSVQAEKSNREAEISNREVFYFNIMFLPTLCSNIDYIYNYRKYKLLEVNIRNHYTISVFLYCFVNIKESFQSTKLCKDSYDYRRISKNAEQPCEK